MSDAHPWDKPNGFCSQCGAPLNACMVGGYRLHDSAFAVPAAVNMTDDQIIGAIEASDMTAKGLREYLARRRAR